MIRGRSTPRLLLVVTLAVAAAVAASGCSSTLSDAATIKYHDAQGDHTAHVSREDLQREVSELVDNPEMRKLLEQNFAVGEKDTSTDSKITAVWLTQIIRQKVIDAEFASQHLSVTPAQTAASTQSLRDAQNGYGPAVFDKFPKSLRDSLVRGDARYQALAQSCASGRLVAHILVKTQAAAEVAVAQLRAGVPFATVAQKSSTDTGSAPAGGVLGCLAPQEFVAEFQKAAEQVPFDTVTPPVKTKFGYHLILVRHWDPRLAANPQIAQLLRQTTDTALGNRLKSLDVRVDPRYGAWGPIKTQNGTVLGVTAPQPPAPRDQREKR